MRAPQATTPATITVTSRSFEDGATIPTEFTCRGAGRFPQLSWRGIPAEARSVALVVRDPDAPGGTFVHWVLYDLPARDGALESGHVPATAREADNSAGTKGWFPPCPPSGTHHYVFTVYALAGTVAGRSTKDVLTDIGQRTIATGTLTGTVAHR